MEIILPSRSSSSTQPVSMLKWQVLLSALHGSLPGRHSWTLPTTGKPKPHWAVGCPACGVAVLSRVALTDFSTALERALKNRSAAPASLPCFRHWRRSAPLQVLLSAVECFQKDYCKRKETAFLESCRRSGSPPGRRSYRPRNRALSNSPLG